MAFLFTTDKEHVCGEPKNGVSCSSLHFSQFYRPKILQTKITGEKSKFSIYHFLLLKGCKTDSHISMHVPTQ